jgi:hypothetical protein
VTDPGRRVQWSVDSPSDHSSLGVPTSRSSVQAMRPSIGGMFSCREETVTVVGVWPHSPARSSQICWWRARMRCSWDLIFGVNVDKPVKVGEMARPQVPSPHWPKMCCLLYSMKTLTERRLLPPLNLHPMGL